MPIHRANVRAERTIVVEADAGIDGQSITEGDRITGERGASDKRAGLQAWRLRDGLKRPPTILDIPRPARSDHRDVMSAPFDLRADLPLVIGTPEPSLIVAERRLDGRTRDLQRAKVWRSLARDSSDAIEMAGRGPIAGGWDIVLRVHESSCAHVPEGVG